MSYDAHIFSPEDEPELPDDFAALGEQLHNDAAALAERFPPQSRPAFPDVPARKFPIRRIAAAAVVAVAVGGAVARTQLFDPVAPDAMSPAVAEAPALPEIISPRRPALQVVPVVLFQTLSDTEQEALLDLMEHDQLDQASLSI